MTQAITSQNTEKNSLWISSPNLCIYNTIAIAKAQWTSQKRGREKYKSQRNRIYYMIVFLRYDQEATPMKS